MEHQITCINCPVGCRMTVIVEDGKVDEDDHPKLKEFLEKVK